jgi:hypothetical protein
MLVIKSVRSLLLISLTLCLFPSTQSADLIEKAKKATQEAWAESKRMAQCTFKPEKYRCSAKEITDARTWAAGATIAAISAAAIATGIVVGAKQISSKKNDTEITINYDYNVEGGGSGGGSVNLMQSELDSILSGNDAALKALQTKLPQIAPGTIILITYNDGISNKKQAKSLRVGQDGNLILGF